MSAFSGPLRLEKIDGIRWVIYEPFTYTTGTGALIGIPAGFLTDLASIPRPLWPIYPPFHPGYVQSAVVHDYLYEHAEQFLGDQDGHLSRSQADHLLRDAMVVEGFRRTGRWAIYAGVRIGGWYAWRRARTWARRHDS